MIGTVLTVLVANLLVAFLWSRRLRQAEERNCAVVRAPRVGRQLIATRPSTGGFAAQAPSPQRTVATSRGWGLAGVYRAAELLMGGVRRAILSLWSSA